MYTCTEMLAAHTEIIHAFSRVEQLATAGDAQVFLGTSVTKLNQSLVIQLILQRNIMLLA